MKTGTLKAMFVTAECQDERAKLQARAHGLPLHQPPNMQRSKLGEALYREDKGGTRRTLLSSLSPLDKLL